MPSQSLWAVVAIGDYANLRPIFVQRHGRPLYPGAASSTLPFLRLHTYVWLTICNKMPRILPGFSMEYSCASTETVCSASLRKFHALPVVTAPYTHCTALCSRSLNSWAAIMVAMHCGNPAFRLSF